MLTTLEIQKNTILSVDSYVTNGTSMKCTRWKIFLVFESTFPQDLTSKNK